jgi:hypothetical protein
MTTSGQKPYLREFSEGQFVFCIQKKEAFVKHVDHPMAAKEAESQQGRPLLEFAEPV